MSIQSHWLEAPVLILSIKIIISPLRAVKLLKFLSPRFISLQFGSRGLRDFVPILILYEYGVRGQYVDLQNNLGNPETVQIHLIVKCENNLQR